MLMAAETQTPRVALIGNPNSGKTALFNLLTGSTQKVANYAGVTVERKEGVLTSRNGHQFAIIDLPGAYSLDATSPDEAVTRDVCLGRYPGERQPDLLVCVVDATNLRLHLRFVLEVLSMGQPMVLALNMMDTARQLGVSIDLDKLSKALGIPVVETVAVDRQGAEQLISCLENPELPTAPQQPALSLAERHQKVRQLLADTVTQSAQGPTITDRIDSVVLHPVLGFVLLATAMFFMFQAVFSWAEPLMDGITDGVTQLAVLTTAPFPKDSALYSLLNDGIFSGLGNVLVFLPQILILFLFILVLEESGYLPRAAYLLDRMMFKAGMTGRAFIPLLSSFACAVPGIMATRSIQNPRDRLTTILVAPLMTCSARLPVYTLLIAAFIPRQTVAGLFNLQGLVLFSLYFAGIISALLVAYVMKWLRREKGEQALLLELPAYRLPNLRDLAWGLWHRAKIFLRRVGGIIFSLTVLLWFLSSFPGPPAGATGPAIDYSFAGKIGHALAYIFAPLGFNWQISVALVPGMAAREVAVSALATVYAMSGSEDAVAHQLGQVIAGQWPLSTALSLLAWYIFAPQCISTLAVIRRETNSWKMMLVAAGYLFALAYLAAMAVYQIAEALL
ncbi:ferrous iron transporter B [Gallaecimonas sp. GXIMD1310]|uniref:ferrous iron transporter B n=1 Tax=Gallaecimonas sp. GXIMD1310 TaxID=3131926 RepID=UPI003253A3B3